MFMLGTVVFFTWSGLIFEMAIGTLSVMTDVTGPMFPSIIVVICYKFTALPFILHWQCFFSSYARGRYVLNGRTTWSRLAYSYVSFPCHMFPDRVFVLSRSRFTCLPYFTNLDWWLVYAYSFVLRLPVSDWRLVCLLVISGLWLVSDSFPFYDCLCISLVHYIYDWGWGLVPHLQSTLQPP